MYIPNVARQRLGENVTAATNTQAAIAQLLDVSFFMRSVSYQRKAGDQFFLELTVNKTETIANKN
jgi:Flp pilus assembly protein TadB